MSMLSDRDILDAMRGRDIEIDPFDPRCLGTNSYDVHLSPTLATYQKVPGRTRCTCGCNLFANFEDVPLDTRVPRATEMVQIPTDGYVLAPGELYLASTVEYVASRAHVPILNGKSSLGRLGLMVHVTAGFGDVGFCNHWTLELAVIKPLRVYPGMKIAQLCWHTVSSRPAVTYDAKPGAKYNVRDHRPAPSESWQDFDKEDGR